ncbi:hypothetical protein JXJ21_05995 [candidate division KSB1 bacterium]|nr:hypothetical protein [candidate division KSB1 bacterium]
MCQIEDIEKIRIEEPISLKVAQALFIILLKLRVPTFVKYIRNIRRKMKLRKAKYLIKNDIQQTYKKNLKPGDIVKVRSKEQIMKTLDKNNKHEGCSFMKEMWQYCGTNQTVLKKVEYFFDEGKNRMRRTRRIVLLKGLHCSGEWPIFKQKCDRYCLFFWKEAWLEKIG